MPPWEAEGEQGNEEHKSTWKITNYMPLTKRSNSGHDNGNG